MSLDEANEKDIKLSIDDVPFVLDRHSSVFIFGTLCISVRDEGEFVVVDKF